MSSMTTACCDSGDTLEAHRKLEKIDRELADLRRTLEDVDQASRDLVWNSAVAGLWSSVQVAVGPAELWVRSVSKSSGGWLEHAYGMWKSAVKQVVAGSAEERAEEAGSQIVDSTGLASKLPGGGRLKTAADAMSLTKTLADLRTAAEKGDEIGGLKALTSIVSTAAELAQDSHVEKHFGMASAAIGAVGETWKGVQGLHETNEIMSTLAPMAARTRVMILNRIRELTRRREQLVREVGGGC